MNQGNKLAGISAGLLLTALAILIAWNTFQMRIPPSYARVGPEVFPYFAAAALAIVGVMVFLQALRGHPDRLVADTEETDWLALGTITLGFVFEILFIKSLGFILSSTVLFGAVSYAFGSRKYVRDIIVALLLTTGAYLVFTKLLNLQLPAGILKGLI
jgi:putative tricarboxylic transport membrane protein